MQNGYWRYARFGNRVVDGWVDPSAFALIRECAIEQERQNVGGGIAEIGVHHGRLFIAMHLVRRQGERSIAVDLFENQALNPSRSGSGNRAAFRRNLARHAHGDTDVVILSQDSSTIDGKHVRKEVGSTIRLFSVDGAHDRDMVAHDMRTAAQALSEGGIILADDVFNEQWPGVHEGVDAFLAQYRNIVPFAVAFNKVLFTTSVFAEDYRRVIMRAADKHRWMHKLTIMNEHPVVVCFKPGMKLRARRFGGKILRGLGLRESRRPSV